MTQEDFIKETRSAYLQARQCIYRPKNSSELLHRGTSHSISSITEDLFGCYCAEKVIGKTENTKIYIDPPISFKGTSLKNKSERKSLLIRPDVAFVINEEATTFFDVKTDLGYKRKDFFIQAKERNIQLTKIKGQRCSYNDGVTKENHSLKISNDIKFIYIIISQGNISKKVQNEFMTQIKELENLNIFLLTTGDHLNEYKDNPNYEINKVEFDQLDSLIFKELNTN